MGRGCGGVWLSAASELARTLFEPMEKNRLWRGTKVSSSRKEDVEMFQGAVEPLVCMQSVGNN